MTRRWPLLLLLAAPVEAQTLALVPVVLDACRMTLTAAECAGLATRACQGDNPTTYSGTLCLQAEYEHWQAAMLRALDAAEAVARQRDAAEQREEGPSRVLGLIAVQGAWENFRNARCHYDALSWWGGSGAGMAEGSCLVRLTAAQVDDLERLAGGER
ncbi:lysozyme inhibitor LprI family protein [Pararhodobacter aggregans]|nr:lysozyme inhibitor LprI family protein [Pararhodobacter aggregans]PTX01884.1 uncharacterized protein YecT (DUF1311 family) [Pararhodobacter aggregans]